MPDIVHQFHFDAPAERIADALMAENAIRKWWTREARIADGKGVFGWSGHGWEVALEMERDGPAGPIHWHCTRSNMQNTAAWEGTTIGFTLHPEGPGTRMEFSHSGYETSPCHAVCSDGWAFFIGRSFKQFVETGTGIPYPEIVDTSKGEHQ